MQWTFKRIDSNHLTAIIYADGQAKSQCRIWHGGRDPFAGGIAYSSNASSRDNSYNEALTVTDDGHSLLLKGTGMAFAYVTNSGEKLLSEQGAAEYLWAILMSPLQD